MSKQMRFEGVMDRQCELLLRFLAREGVQFALVCPISEVTFMPPLPEEMVRGFQPQSLFVLAGYTLDSLEILSDGICFEAGFGRENIGHFVSVDFRHILQVVITTPKGKDIPLFTRMDSSELFEVGGAIDDEIRSMEAILSNPHNRKYLLK